MRKFKFVHPKNGRKFVKSLLNAANYAFLSSGIFKPTFFFQAKYIELNEQPEGAALQSALAGVSGQRTVPNVFVNGQHLGRED